MKYNFDKMIDRKNTHSLKWDSNQRIFGSEVLPMWVADMDFEAPPSVLDAIRGKVDHGILGYSIKSNNYYESIINWMFNRHHWSIQREWIVSAPGVVPSLNLCVLAYTEPGDKILVQSPVYYPFFSVIQNNKRHIVNNPLVLIDNQFEINFDDLEKKLASGVRLMIFCNPHNPGGRVWEKDTVQKVAELCLQYNTLLISDEIHSDLIFPGYKHTIAAALSESYANNTVNCFAPSKTFNLAGLAASYVIIPSAEVRSKYIKAMDRIGGDMTNIFGDVGLEAAYCHGEDWLEELLAYLKNNLDYTITFLSEHIPSVKAIEPQGTYLVWLDFRALGITHKELMHFIIREAKVGLSSGAVFGEGGEGFLRLNIACPRAILIQGLNQIKCAIDEKF